MAETPRERMAGIARWAVLSLLLGYSAAVFVTNICPTRRTLAKSERHLEDLEKRNVQIEERTRALDAEAEQLVRDPWTVERILRDEYRMSNEGEVLVR